MNYKITTLVENCVYGRKLQAMRELPIYLSVTLVCYISIFRK